MLKEFKVIMFVLLVTVLSSCSFFNEDPYCFLETNLGKYCAVDQKTYESIEIELRSQDIMLSDLVKENLFNHKYTFIEEVFFIPEESEVVYKGEYFYSRRNSEGIIEETPKKFEIRKVENTLNDDRDMSVMMQESKEYCMGSVGDYNSYYLHFEDGTVAPLSYLNYHEDNLSLDDYGVTTFVCDSESFMVGETELFTHFKNQETHIVVNHGYPFVSNPAFSSYNDNDEKFCVLPSMQMETNFLKIGDDYIEIQDALDDEQLQGDDLSLYSIPRCDKEKSQGLSLIMSSNTAINGVPLAFEVKTKSFKLDGTIIVIDEYKYENYTIRINGLETTVKSAIIRSDVSIEDVWENNESLFIAYRILD